MRRRSVAIVALLALAGLVPPLAAAQQAIPPCAGRIENANLALLLQVRGVRDAGASPEVIAETAAVIAERAAAIAPDGCAIRIDRDGYLIVTLACVAIAPLAVATLTRPGLLEIVDPAGQFLPAGTLVETTLGGDATTPAAGSPVAAGPVYRTIISNEDIAGAYRTTNRLGQPVVGFDLTAEAAAEFSAYTSAHVGQPMAIVLDKRIVSTPVINSAIAGQGIIEGLPEAEVEALVVQLRTRSLPAPVEVVWVQTLAPGPTAKQPPIAGVQTFDELCCQHSEEPVVYAEDPPAGGVHHPVWQDCGFYDAPVGNEHAVHSLEHGAVWITYAVDLSAAQVETLRRLTLDHPYLLVSPYPGLPAPVVASAWNAQLRLADVADPRLAEFIATYEEQGPELGASCENGTAMTLPVTPTP